MTKRTIDLSENEGASSTTNALKSDLDECFGQYCKMTTNRVTFSNQVSLVLEKHLGDKIDGDYIFMSISRSEKTTLTFLRSLVTCLAMRGNWEKSVSLSEKAKECFPCFFNKPTQLN